MSTRQHGVGIIEFAIAIAVLALLVMLSAPTFTRMLEGFRVRAAAEAFAANIQLARSEAVKRSRKTQFVHGSVEMPNPTTDYASYVADPNGFASLIRSVRGATGGPYTAITPASDGLIEVRSGASGGFSTLAALDAPAAYVGVITFDDFGRLDDPDVPLLLIIRPRSVAACSEPGRCAAVAIDTAGAVRVCDPTITVTTDSRRC